MNHDGQSPKYRTAYVTQLTHHDFSELYSLCEEIVFLLPKMSLQPQDLETLVAEKLVDFDPLQDLIVPIGFAYMNVVLGILLAAKIRAASELNIVLYVNNQYYVRHVTLNGLIEVSDEP